VIIEVSIVDVILTDDLKYGVEWYFENSLGGLRGKKTGIAELNFGSVAAGATGFSYSVIDSSGDIRAVLNALAEESKINVISSPSLMVLDNNTAQIQVGNQQPVRTAKAVADSGAIVENIEFKDTGVKLEVTPSVNPGGLVTMEVNQEVTDVGKIDDATGQRSFLKRLVNSTVAVKTGQTIVLGGLITENNTVSESGIPGLYKLPVVGKLFGSTSNSNSRNELLVLLTPSVVEKPTDAAAVLDEYRKSMKSLKREWIFKE
jgi:general secretion pathway protein D